MIQPQQMIIRLFLFSQPLIQIDEWKINHNFFFLYIEYGLNVTNKYSEVVIVIIDFTNKNIPLVSLQIPIFIISHIFMIC